MTITSYRDLIVWRKGVDLVSDLYRLTSNFPKEERYGLSSQIRRAAVSIPANISEGYARRSRGTYAYHLSVASGSVAELRTLLVVSQKLGFLTLLEIAPSEATPDELAAMLWTMINKIAPKKERFRQATKVTPS